MNKKFDLIYCRFLLHHLQSPRKTIKIFYEALNPNGIYIGEEGIIHAAFAYPPTNSWVGYMPNLKNPSNDIDGEDRDGDFGMKLFYYSKQAGFDVIACNLVQPMLWKEAHKQLILANSLAFKQTAIEQGMTEEAWQEQFAELERCVKDGNQAIAFYQSCQIAAVKNI